MSKRIDPKDAVALIADGATLAVDGFVGSATPEELLGALESRYRETGRPKGLTIFAATGQGDAQGRGLDTFIDPRREGDRVNARGPVLTEVSPSVDLERDILAHMAFRPRVAPDIKTMDIALFRPAPINLEKYF
jgi:acyl CoA:acetate/3-ketoacid CoA transferase